MEGGGTEERLDCSVCDVLMEDACGWRTCARGGPSGERDDCLRLGDVMASLKEGKEAMHVKSHQPAQSEVRGGSGRPRGRGGVI